MNFRTLILRSLRFHWRAHLGVVLGAVVGSAALIGALVVGDSVRESLRELALQRLGPYDLALAPLDRFFTEELADAVHPPNGWVANALRLSGTAALPDGSARANQINVIGVRSNFWPTSPTMPPTNIPPDGVLLNPVLAAQLNARVGDTVILRINKPSALSRDVPITPQSDASLALRRKVMGVASANHLGNFSLQANQVPPFNAFVNLKALAKEAGLADRANLLLIREGAAAQTGHTSAANASDATGVKEADQSLASALTLADLEVQLLYLTNPGALELQSSRIFIDPPVARAAESASTNATGVLTYLVNLFRAGTNTTPYSMVTAVGAPWTPPDMKVNEILVNQWLADDLHVKPGDTIALSYFLPESAARLVEATNQFIVRSIVPMAMPWADRTLMPEFPGLAKAESTHDWDAGFPLVYRIRDKDEAYWKQRRGTPKTFITLAAGQKLWSNRFGDLTAIRYSIPANAAGGPNASVNAAKVDAFRQTVAANILANLKPEAVGLRFVAVREQALNAASQSQDFGGLFIGFSFFLIIAALILMALLFQFGLEQRITEIGTLLALGFRPRQVRRLFLGEGVALAAVGGLLGMGVGLAYAWLMLRGLTTIWRDAVRTSALSFHVTPATLFIGAISSVVVSAFTIWLALRKQAKQPARQLLAGEIAEPKFKSKRRRLALWGAIASLAIALGLLGWTLSQGETGNAEVFFEAGSLLLLAGILFLVVWLRRLAGAGVADGGNGSPSTSAVAHARASSFTLSVLTMRALARRRSRSLAVVGLLACGSFLIAAIGAFQLNAHQDAWQRSSGTGGFALIGESALPVIRDLNTERGLEFYGLDKQDVSGVSFVPFRVRSGDNASCLNLNRAQNPQLLGVNLQLLAERHAFTFAKVAPGYSAEAGWTMLQQGSASLGSTDTASRDESGGPVTNEIPAIGDLNSILWAMHKQVGDTIDFVDENGQPFKVRLVGALANSILQGSLIISDKEFVKRFPGESGYRTYLIDAPTNQVAAVSATLSRALQDAGMELTPATQRLAQFNAVQNTYLSTFQILGGLGLLLGSAGLGVVVLRNVLERRGELALLLAVGFRRRTLRQLILGEHGGLLVLGLGLGIVAAVVAILPQLLAPGAETDYLALGVTLVGVLASGLVWTWLATLLALRGNLLDALRNE